MRNRVYSKLAVGLLLSLPALAGEPSLVVDRGLPQANLNDVSGLQRSNVRWGWQEEGFLGDSFRIGAPGERWVIDSIRTWVIPGTSEYRLPNLGDFFRDVRLYVGGAKDDLTPVTTGQLTAGSDEASNPAIRISEATREGAILYDNAGTPLRIWQVEFTGLNLTVEGGADQRFGVWGMGRAVPGLEGRTFTWYNHASNASLSVSQQDGSDNRMILFNGAGRSQGDFNAEGNGWDKPADINIQVFGHRVDGLSRRPVTTRR